MLQITRGFAFLALCGAVFAATAAAPAHAAEATIADLKVNPIVYAGLLYANTDPDFQGEAFAIRVDAKIGKQFTGASLVGDLQGKLKPHAVFTATCHTVAPFAGGGFPGLPGGIHVLGGANTLTFNGKLSSDGTAIVGTYQIKGTINHKGTFWMDILHP